MHIQVQQEPSCAEECCTTYLIFCLPLSLFPLSSPYPLLSSPLSCFFPFLFPLFSSSHHTFFFLDSSYSIAVVNGQPQRLVKQYSVDFKEQYQQERIADMVINCECEKFTWVFRILSSSVVCHHTAYKNVLWSSH